MPEASLGTESQGYLQQNGVEFEQVEISATGLAGQQTLHTVVGAKCRVIELTVRHAGTNDAVVTLLISGGNTKLTLDVPHGTTREWESVVGRIFTVGQVIAVQTSDVVGGSTFISGSGVEA